MYRRQVVLALASASLVLAVGCGTRKGESQTAPPNSLSMQQNPSKPAADQASSASKENSTQSPELRYDGKLVLKLVAIGNTKVEAKGNQAERYISESLESWAPDGGPYVGKKLPSYFCYTVGPEEESPDKVLHIELSGEGPQAGAIYVLPGKITSSTAKPQDKRPKVPMHWYTMQDGSVSQIELPYFSGGRPSASITVALTKSKPKTVNTFKPPFDIDTKNLDTELAKLSNEPGRHPRPEIFYPLAKGDWGSMDFRVTNTIGSFVYKVGKKLPEPGTEPRKHSVYVRFTPKSVPLKQTVQAILYTKDGKRFESFGGMWEPMYAEGDSGPKLEDIESIEIKTCAFRTYTFPIASLKRNPAKFSGAVYGKEKPRSSAGVSSAASVDSIGVYDVSSDHDTAVNRYTPDGKPWYDSAFDQSSFNSGSPYPYNVYEVRLNLNCKILSDGRNFRATAYSLPSESSRVAKGKLLESKSIVPGFSGILKLAGEPAKSDRFLRVDLEVTDASWKSIGKTSEHISRMARLLEKNKEWVKKWAEITPFEYWIDESGALKLRYAEPKKTPKTVSTGIKVSEKNCQVRLVPIMATGERMERLPSWQGMSGGATMAFQFGENKEPVFEGSGGRLRLKDLKSVEVQTRSIRKVKPITLKMPPPPERSKALVLEVK